MSDLKQYPISINEVLRARQTVRRYCPPNAMVRYEALSKDVGAEMYVKHENHSPIGCFKIRGGVTLAEHLAREKVNGVITYSTGNHGLSVATGARWLGVKAVIVLPTSASAVKKKAIRDCGAELVEAGETFEDCARVVEQLSQERGYYFAHPCNEPLIIDGVGTEFVEVLEEVPDVDVLIVPIGGGSEAAAAVTVLRALKPSVEIIAVQSAASPAAYQSWKTGQIQSAPNQTFAGGVATGRAYEIPFSIYKDALADFIVLTDDEILTGIALAAHYTHNLVEGSGALPMMAAFKLRERLQGKRVVIQMSGCNAAPEEIQKALVRPAYSQGWAAVAAAQVN